MVDAVGYHKLIIALYPHGMASDDVFELRSRWSWQAVMIVDQELDQIDGEAEARKRGFTKVNQKGRAFKARMIDLVIGVMPYSPVSTSIVWFWSVEFSIMNSRRLFR